MAEMDKEEHIPYTTEGMEQECIAMAMAEARKRLADGTASPAIIVHFLKRATKEAQVKEDKLEAETALINQKKTNMELAQKEMDVYSNAIEAFKSYNGGGV